MRVVVVGAQETRAKLGALPGRLREGAQTATARAIETEANAIRSSTPRRTGTLAGSIQTSVTSSVQGARGRVFSDERYALFVELGTRRHGVGRHMFERGAEQVRGQVEDQYEAAVNEIASSI
jgi:bacteriophage HK97-gp10 putative tail-component